MDFMEWYIVAACFGAALLCLYWTGRAFWLWQSIPNWPRVEGRVLKSETRVKSRRRHRRYYALDASIAYTFRGQEYKNKHPVPGGLVTQTKAGVEAVADTLPVGDTVKLYVNPNKPKESFIENVAPWRILALILCALCFGGAGLKVLYDQHKGARQIMDQYWEAYRPDPNRDVGVND